jgi:hypothetical protein
MGIAVPNIDEVKSIDVVDEPSNIDGEKRPARQLPASQYAALLSAFHDASPKEEPLTLVMWGKLRIVDQNGRNSDVDVFHDENRLAEFRYEGRYYRSRLQFDDFCRIVQAPLIKPRRSG